MSSMNIHEMKLPFDLTPDGTLRISGGRVSLDVIVAEYRNGASPEWIARNFEPLRLADVYLTIAYYLQHREEVDRYLSAREKEADATMRELSKLNPKIEELNERLKAIKRHAEVANVQTAQ